MGHGAAEVAEPNTAIVLLRHARGTRPFGEQALNVIEAISNAESLFAEHAGALDEIVRRSREVGTPIKHFAVATDKGERIVGCLFAKKIRMGDDGFFEQTIVDVEDHRNAGGVSRVQEEVNGRLLTT